MVQRNAIIVGSIIGGAILVIFAIMYVRQSGLVAATFDRGQRFTAKPGTTRKNAIILTSDKRPAGEDPENAIARRVDEVEDSDPLEVKSLSRKNSAARSGPAHETAQSALNSFTPEAGLRQLDTALATPQSPSQSALLYEARGQLCAQLDPPDYEASREAFETALEMAEDPDLKEEIAYSAAQVLMQAGNDAEATARIETQLAEKPPAGETGYKLQLLHAQLQERSGELEQAEKTYQAVLAAVETVPEGMDKSDALSIARTAGMRLTNLYRSHDRRQAADELSASLRKQFSRMAETVK